MSGLALVFLALGLFFAIVGNLGVLRFRDPYTRLHAAAKCSTTTVLSVLIACAILEGWGGTTWRILIIAVFFLITSPVASHVIGRSAWLRGVVAWRPPRKEESNG